MMLILLPFLHDIFFPLVFLYGLLILIFSAPLHLTRLFSWASGSALRCLSFQSHCTPDRSLSSSRCLVKNDCTRTTAKKNRFSSQTTQAAVSFCFTASRRLRLSIRFQRCIPYEPNISNSNTAEYCCVSVWIVFLDQHGQNTFRNWSIFFHPPDQIYCLPIFLLLFRFCISISP